MHAPLILMLSFCSMLMSCTYNNTLATSDKNKAFQIIDTEALSLLDVNANIEELATGFIWTEGPLWLKKQKCLLFSDIPNATVMRYCPDMGLDTYLNDSKFSNGLLLDHNDNLLLMQSRSRRVAKMDASLDQPEARYKILSSHYENKKLNSPNDATMNSQGELYFTDPPYGLPEQLNDPNKELGFQGVYKLSNKGALTLLDSSLTYPNGISLIDGGKRLIVAVSDPKNPSWYVYDVDENGLLQNRKQFASALDHEVKRHSEGLPDGLKQHKSGAIFASGPGGVWVFNTNGKLLAHIAVIGPVANLAFNEQQDTLYLTAKDRLLQIKLNKH